MMEICDRTLDRWLRTGRPRRVERLLERSEALVDRLEEMTRLDDDQRDALARALHPPVGFHERVVTSIVRRSTVELPT